MSARSADLFCVAVRLDEYPSELLNGGAADALRALDAVAPEAVASRCGIEAADVQALWDRAGAHLRKMPADDMLFPVAAEAATLLYAAAWAVDAERVTSEDLRALM
jgi:hypothetical protein